MKQIGHGLLKGFSSIFKVKGHLSICECSPRVDKSCFMLIFQFDMNLIVTGEPIHEGEYLISNTIIDDLINEWCWVIFLRIGFD